MTDTPADALDSTYRRRRGEDTGKDRYAHIGYRHLDIYLQGEVHGIRLALNPRHVLLEDILIGARRVLLTAGYAIGTDGFRKPLCPNRDDLLATCALIPSDRVPMRFAPGRPRDDRLWRPDHQLRATPVTAGRSGG